MAERYDRFCYMCVSEVLRKSGFSDYKEEGVLDGVCAVFEESGGSWVALAEATSDSWALLKQACKLYLKTHKKP